MFLLVFWLSHLTCFSSVFAKIWSLLQIFDLQFWYEHFRNTPLRFKLLHISKQNIFFPTFSESEISIVQEMIALCSHFEVPHEVFTQKLILYYFLIKFFHEELPNVVFQILLLSSYFCFCDTQIWLGFFEFNSSGKKSLFFSNSFLIYVSSHFMSSFLSCCKT